MSEATGNEQLTVSLPAIPLGTFGTEGIVERYENPVRQTDEGAFTQLSDVLRKYFYQPDTQAIRIVLGTLKTHYLDIGDPAWLFVIAPPGSGKTTMSMVTAAQLPHVVALGDISENTFLSGFFGHKEPGLLEKTGATTQQGNSYTTVGDAIFMCKDFTTVLSMRPEKKAAILGQLREIHDGSFKRDFGTGESKVWRGRVTFIAAVTPAIDTHLGVFRTLGERFLQVRWHRPSSETAGVRAIEQQGSEKQIRDQIAKEVQTLFESALTQVPTLSAKQQQRIAALAEIVARGRTHVHRNSYNREIEHVPEPEANTRLSKGIAAVAKGIAALNRHPEVTEQDLQDAMRVGTDSLPDDRRRLLLAALRDRPLTFVPMAKAVRFRQIEELEALDLLGSDGSLTKSAKRLLETAEIEGRVSGIYTRGVRLCSF